MSDDKSIPQMKPQMDFTFCSDRELEALRKLNEKEVELIIRKVKTK